MKLTQNSNKPKIIFVHQPKTGGSTLVNLFRRTYGKQLVFRDSDIGIRRTKNRLNRFIEKTFEDYYQYNDRKDYEVIHGHFSPTKYKRAFPNACFITIYRHPIQQIISHYYYWKRAPIIHEDRMNPLWKKLINENLSLEKFARLFIKEEKKQINFFDPLQFDFIGITEKYEKTIKLLKKTCVPELIPEIEGIRVNPSKKIGDNYTNFNQQLFEELLKEDIIQYNQALNIFNRTYKKELPNE